MMMGRRMIKKLRDCVADLVESRPIEIAKHDALFRFLLRGFDETHLRAKVSPSLVVENQPIDPLPKLRVHRFWKIVLPPKIKRQIRIEMGKDNTRQEFYAWTFQRERKLLRTNLFVPRATDMAMCVDSGFDPVLCRVSIRPDPERASGMFLVSPRVH